MRYLSLNDRLNSYNYVNYKSFPTIRLKAWLIVFLMTRQCIDEIWSLCITGEFKSLKYDFKRVFDKIFFTRKFDCNVKTNLGSKQRRKSGSSLRNVDKCAASVAGLGF